MTAFHYDHTPTPVGLPVNLNGDDSGYQVGFYDGGDRGDQYADEPNSGVLFESPEGAAEWLDAVKKVLTPYIDSGNRAARIPDPEGWAVDE